MLLANAGAFAVLLAELIILEHADGIQLIAPSIAAAGMVLCLAVVLLRGRLALPIAVLFVVLSFGGVFGFFRHLDEREDGLSLLAVPVAEARDQAHPGGPLAINRDNDDDRDDDDDDDPPPLAPLGLTGTAMLSALAAIAIRPARTDDDAAL